MMTDPLQGKPDEVSDSKPGLRLRSPLTGAFAAIILLLLSVSILGIRQMQSLNDELETVVSDKLAKTLLINKMLASARERSLLMVSMALESDAIEREEIFDRFNNMAGSFIKARDSYLAMTHSPDEQQLIDDMNAQIALVVPLQREVTELLRLGQDGQASDILLEKAIPIQNKNLEIYEQMLQTHQQSARESLDLSRIRYEQSADFIALLTAVTIGISIAIALLVTRKIHRAETGLLELAESLDVRVMQRTEELTRALDQNRSYAEQLNRKTVELRNARDEALLATQHKSEFLANMSHELRTPLNAIIGFSEVLAERMFGELNDKQDEYVQDIHASGKHLLALINEILDLSKIEAGQMDLNLAKIDLERLIDESLVLVRERAARHGIDLHTHVAPAMRPLTVDERKVKQVLLNLLTNAVKFTQDGGRVDVEVKDDAAAVTVSVIDNGIGISEADQERIFEAFRQVDTHGNRTQEGTGLGLSLSKSFVEMHGGVLILESRPGAGSRFTLTLPRKS